MDTLMTQGLIHSIGPQIEAIDICIKVPGVSGIIKSSYDILRKCKRRALRVIECKYFPSGVCF